jgi:hypothetical protein
MVTFISDARPTSPNAGAKAALRFAGLDEARERQLKAELPASPLERRQVDSERRAGALLKTGGWVSR